jgi:hypothetical protein
MRNFYPKSLEEGNAFLVDRALRRAMAINGGEAATKSIERRSARSTYGVGNGLGSMSGA